MKYQRDSLLQLETSSNERKWIDVNTFVDNASQILLVHDIQQEFSHSTSYCRFDVDSIVEDLCLRLTAEQDGNCLLCWSLGLDQPDGVDTPTEREMYTLTIHEWTKGIP